MHNPSNLIDDLLGQTCSGDTTALTSVTQEAGTIFSAVSLKLFPDADSAGAYLDTVSRCLTDNSAGYTTADKTTAGPITLVTIEAWGGVAERFAAYSNVIVDDYGSQSDWPSFASGQFKPAVDEAGKR